MSTRTLLNLILASVALLLVLVVFYQPGLEPEQPAPPITTIPVESISSVRVTRKERTPLTFTKSATGWQLEQQQDLPASKFQIHALLGILGTRPARSYPSSELNLASAGLEPPQATLLLNDTLIYIGNTEPLEHKRYIQHADRVYLVTDTYQHLINADWTNFVDRRLLPENAMPGSVQLPGNPDIEASDMPALLAQWQTATATYVRRYQGKATSDTIIVKLAGSDEAITLTIVEQEPELVLARPEWSVQYHFPGQMRDALLGQPAQEETSKQ